MNSIRVLAPNVANRIAAGEVVERPSSVVKELVENAIDAGATAITVEIENGGIDYIRVSDNGCGIPEDDCATAFLRHATSKITKAEDITHIHTLGFRGEALASIASVSDIILKTRTANADSGTKLHIDNGVLLEQTPCACTEGTVFEIRNLFSKTPARLKFLKNPRIEAGYIGDYLSRMIMAMPDISFVYVNNGKTVYRTYGDGSLRNAVFSIYGSEILPQLREVFFDDGYLRINGFIGTPAIARPNRLQQSLFLNGRYIRSISVSSAVQRAYDTRLMSGRFPVFILFIRMAAQEIDVNVHPTKMEVRFADERRITASVYSACVQALEKPIVKRDVLIDDAAERITQREYDHDEVNALQINASASCKHKLLNSNMQSADGSSISTFVSESNAVHKESIAEKESAFPDISIKVPDLSALPKNEKVLVRESMPSASIRGMSKQDAKNGESFFSKKSVQAKSIPIFEIVSHKKAQEQALDEIKLDEPIRFGVDEFRLIGAAFSGYWLVEQGDVLYLIDQHAAHERKLYEDLMSRRIKPSVQSLLVPQRVRFTPNEISRLEEFRDVIEEFGFSWKETEEPLEIELLTVPQIGNEILSANRLRDAMELFRQTGDLNCNELCRKSLIQTACKHAVKVNETISRAEIQHLLAEYAEGKIPLTCPHGRPVMVMLSKLDIEKMFKRVL